MKIDWITTSATFIWFVVGIIVPCLIVSHLSTINNWSENNWQFWVGLFIFIIWCLVVAGVVFSIADSMCKKRGREMGETIMERGIKNLFR